MKFSSLAALKVVILTTAGAASDENFVKMTTFLFQWMPRLCQRLKLGSYLVQIQIMAPWHIRTWKNKHLVSYMYTDIPNIVSNQTNWWLLFTHLFFIAKLLLIIHNLFMLRISKTSNQKDGQGESSIPPSNFVGWGYNNLNRINYQCIMYNKMN